MRPAPRNARAPQRDARPSPPPRRGVRREFSAEDQADIQETALVRMWRSKGIHVRAYELDGVMRFEQVAEVVPLAPRAAEPAPPADPVLAAIETTRLRWAADRERHVDLEAVRAAMRSAFPGRETRVLPVDGYPGVARILVAVEGGWRSRYVRSVAEVVALASGARRNERSERSEPSGLSEQSERSERRSIQETAREAEHGAARGVKPPRSQRRG